jgi:DNA repair exonuclease SbcCD nuclease subunit
MKLGFVSDVHVGNHRRCGGPVVNGLNERCRTALDVLRRAGQLAADNGCERLYILGDLFETADPSPRIVSATMEVLEALADDIELRVVAGNHDIVSSERGDNALGPLSFLGNDDMVIDGTTIDVFGVRDPDARVVTVPYQPGRAKTWLPATVAELLGEASQGEELTALGEGRESSASRLPLRVLALHLGIVQPITPGYLKNDPDAVDHLTLVELAQRYGYRYVFSGHWHQHWVSGLFGKSDDHVTLVQVGALCPRGWSDEGAHTYGRIVIAEGGKLPEVVEVGGPRFLVARGRGGLKDALDKFKPQRELEGAQLYVDWRVVPDMVDQARAELAEALESGDVYRGEINLDDGKLKADARSVAASVRSSESLDEAISRYVVSMDLPEGVSAEVVLERTRSYLSGGAR